MSWTTAIAGAIARLPDQVRRRTEMPVVLGIDVEPDPRTFDPGNPPPWDGLERFLELVPDLRRRLAQATGAPVSITWFLRMDPQVAETWGVAGWVAERYGDELAGLEACGDELALHTHTWRWLAEEDEWIADYEDPAWVEHVLTVGLDAFESAIGRPCGAYRGGDYFLNGAMLAQLEARGVKVDLTVEPGRPPQRPPHGEPSRGLLPDYREVPPVPYRSSPGRFPAADPARRDGLLLIPGLSTPGKRGVRWPLGPETTVSRFYPRLAAQLIREPLPVAAVMARSDASITPRWDPLVTNLEHLARHRQVRFITASAAAERFGAAA